MNLSEYHSQFPNSVRWRITPTGLEIEGQGVVAVPPARLQRAKAYLERYAELAAAASRDAQVPFELIAACSLTESSIDDPKTPIHENETCIRREPGYVSDEATPDRISAGMCQMLIGTARRTMANPAIDRAWLLQPANALLSCAKYIAAQRKITGFDPVLVACGYNAGGLYNQQGAKNRWKLRQFPIGASAHADRFVEYFNAVLQLVEAGALNGHEFVRYRTLLEAPVY